MSKPIRVLIADDHAIVRQGLRQILSDTADLTVAGEAENGVQAVQLVRSGEWDVGCAPRVLRFDRPAA